MEAKDILKSFLYQFAKTIDDALLPQTAISSMGLEIASKIKSDIKADSSSQDEQQNIEPTVAAFVNEVSGFFRDFGYFLSPESMQKDYVRFKVKECPFADGNSPSLCAAMRGIIGGFGYLNFGYCKIVPISGPEQAPNPCSVDVYFAPSPELDRKVGLEYSRKNVSILKGEDNGFIDSQRQTRRKILLGLFSSLALLLSNNPSEKNLAQKFIESLSNIPEIRIAALYLRDGKNQKFNLEAHYGLPEDFLPIIRTIAEVNGGKRSLLATVEDFNGARTEIAKKLSVRSFATIQIKPRDSIIGVLTIGWKSIFPVSPESREAIRAASTLLGTAIEGNRLYAELETRYVDNISVLNSLVNEIDRFSNDHSKRVAELAKSIAIEMDLSEEDIMLVYEAGLIHDIGKIKIPMDILNKPESLSKEEYEIVKAHPKIGANLIQGVWSLQKIAPAILYHHERLDGSGYPERLSGDKIPIHARIIAVADVFDAMMSKRAHRAAISQADALQEIVNDSGIKFDPIVVGALVTVVSKNKFSENDLSKNASAKAGYL